MKRLTIGLLLAALGAAPALASSSGKVLSTTGRLTAGGKALVAGDSLPSMEITLDQGSATLAVEGGRLLLTGPARFTPRPTGFRLTLGSLLSALRHGQRRFVVRTPTAVAAVRGTDFYVGVDSDGATDVCICKGAVEVSAKGMKTVPMTAENHLNWRFVKNGSGVSGAKAPMRGHTDAELDVLRGLLAAEKP